MDWRDSFLHKEGIGAPDYIHEVFNMNTLHVCPGIQSHITYHIGNSVPSWTESCMTHVLWTETLRFPRSNSMDKMLRAGNKRNWWVLDQGSWSWWHSCSQGILSIERKSNWILPSFFFVINHDTCLDQFTSRVRCQISADGAHVSTAGPWLIITDILKSAADSQYNMYQTLLEYKQELCERMTV